MNTQILPNIIKKNDFYKQNFKRMINVLLVSILLNIILVITMMFIWHKAPSDNYFAVNNIGQLIQLESNKKPDITNNTIISWISNTIPNIYALDFLNYRQELDYNSRFFTTYGWENFANAFRGILKKIKNDKLVSKATITGVPVITGAGYIKGVRTWRAQVPILISFQHGNQQQHNTFLLTLTIQEKNHTRSNDYLIGIAQIIQQKMPQA